MFMCSTAETCVRLGANSPTGGAKDGISALYVKASRSLFGTRRPVIWTPPAGSDRVSAPPNFASEGCNDLAFLSLSKSGDDLEARDPDVSCLGPKPNGDAASEMGRLSLSWDDAAHASKPGHNWRLEIGSMHLTRDRIVAGARSLGLSPAIGKVQQHSEQAAHEELHTRQPAQRLRNCIKKAYHNRGCNCDLQNREHAPECRSQVGTAWIVLQSAGVRNISQIHLQISSSGPTRVLTTCIAAIFAEMAYQQIAEVIIGNNLSCA
jgi:hypothetical protein